MADLDFQNPIYVDDYEDEETPLLDESLQLRDNKKIQWTPESDWTPESVGDNALPSIPGESADTLRNNQARKDFYDFLSETGWGKVSDIDKDALTRNQAFIHRDRDGKVYVRHLGEDVLLSKERGSGFAMPSTIANHANKKGISGNLFERDVLGLKDYGTSGNTSMSKFFKDAAIKLARDTQSALNNVDKGEDIELENLNQSADDLTVLINENDEADFQTPPKSSEIPNEQSFTPRTRRNLERAHKSVNTIDRQLWIANSKIVANNEEIMQLKQERDDPETSQNQQEEIDSKIREVEKENNMQRQLIKDLKPEIRNQLVAIRETLHKVLYEDKTLGEKLCTLFREQGVTIASLLTAIGMTVSAVVEGIILASKSKPKPPSPKPGPKPDIPDTPIEPPKPAPSPEPPKTWTDWIRDQLKKIADLLLKLGDKILIALPGSVINFVLKTAASVAGFLADHLWAFAAIVGGILYTYVTDIYSKKKD